MFGRSRSLLVSLLLLPAASSSAEAQPGVPASPDVAILTYRVFGTGMPKIEMPTGSLRGLHLEVPDIAEARSRLIDRGVDVSEIEDVNGIEFASFADPDGNTWAVFH